MSDQPVSGPSAPVGSAEPSGVRERPILFSAPMVRALLDGRKTQTRRMVKDLMPRLNDPAWIEQWHVNVLAPSDGLPKWTWWDGPPHGQSIQHWATCPYGVPGDLLWVREQFSGPYWLTGNPPCEWPLLSQQRDLVDPAIWYWADGEPADGDWTRPKPSIHMPRWASRISLRITDVRVERLQDISRADAIAEGIRRAENDFGNGPSYCDYGMGDQDDTAEWFASPVDSYRSLWNAINGPGSWGANPWVWAVSFERANDASPAEAASPESGPTGVWTNQSPTPLSKTEVQS